jgi:hypothetical protein
MAVDEVKHPFKISESPPWHERYFYWFFSTWPIEEIPLRALLLPITAILFLFVGIFIRPQDGT